MKKFKTALAIVLALSTMFVVSACGKKEEAPAPAPTEEKTDGNTAESTTGKKYIVATDTTFAPFEFEDVDGNFIGIDMDLLKAIALDQGFEYEIQPLGFNAAVQSLEANQCDVVIAGMSITEDRKAKFDFSDPYFDSGVVMGIAENDETTKSYDDLKDKKVAVKTGTEGATFAESIKEQYGFETTYFEDSANLYEEVKSGNAVACFEDYPVIGYAITQNVGLKIVTDKEAGNSYGIAVGKGINTDLLTKINTGLANIKANGEYDKILAKYIQE